MSRHISFGHHRQWTVCLILAAMGVVTDTHASLEAPAPDPLTLALAGDQPAWSDPTRLPIDGVGIIGGPTTVGATAVVSRLDALPELRSPGAALWFPVAGCRVAARLMDRGIDGYQESELQVDVVRPTRRASEWGLGLTMGAGAWRAWTTAAPGTEAPADAGSSGWLVGLAIGGQVGSRTALAARWVTRGGGLAQSAPDRVALGGVMDITPGWRIGVALDAGAPGQTWRLQTGMEWRASSQFALRGGFRPADGQIGIGMAASTSLVRLEIGRRIHPRLGSWTAVGLSFRMGGRKSGEVEHAS